MVLHQHSYIGTVSHLVCIHHLHVRQAEKIHEAETKDEKIHAQLLVREEEDSVVQKVTDEEEDNTVPNPATAALATSWT